jgi:ABC-type transport system involved in multi-copper enzyme maturation permease subunit
VTRVLAFERVRATSLRSTWIFPLIGVVISVLAALLGNVTASDGWSATLSNYVPDSFTFISALFITIPFAQAFGHEYRDGTMRLTLSLFPHRRQVFAAKLAVPTVVAVIGATASVLAISAIGLTSGHVTDAGALPSVLVRCVGFTVLWGLLVASITVLTRNLAAGVTGVLIWYLLVEQLLLSLVGNSVDNLDEYMPLLNGQKWMSTGEVRGAIVMLVPTLVVALVALVKFERNDA